MRFLIAGVLLVAAALSLAACGSDESGDGATTAAASASGETIEVSATEFAFDPPTIQLDQAGEYTFRLTNDGGALHALEIEGAGIEEATTDSIGPGETAEITVELQEGEYEIYCPVDGHRDMGMEGTLVVGGGGAGGAGTSTDDDEGTTTDDEGTTTEDEGETTTEGGYSY
ncbi:MAG: cupredoxin domain-containing protein [Gaiellaceae bacterium]